MAATARMLCAVALAQTVPEQFVVSGKAAEKIQDFTTINLATAERIADVCEKAATAQGVQISIMVLDNDGNQVYMDRMDGQGYLNIITADMKARTALMGREPSKNRMNRVIEDPAQELQLIQLGFFANSGGLPIVVNKQLIGAVGVGGSAPHPPVWSDEICAHKALVEVIGPSGAAAGGRPSAAPEPQSGQCAGSALCDRDAAQIELAGGIRRGRQGCEQRLRRQSDFARGSEEDRTGVSRLGGVQGRHDVALRHR